MKVLFINTVYGRGSTGRIVKQIGERLEQDGHSYMVAYGRGEKVADPHTYFVGGKLSSYWHAAMARITDKCGFYSRRATRKLLKFIRQYQPDVIHLHNLHGYYINIELLFAYLKNEFTGKVIWTLHDCWAYTGHCVHYTCAGCAKWRTGCMECPQKSSYPASLLIDNSASNYVNKKSLFTGVPNMTVVTVSDWLKSEAERSFLGQYPIVRVYNGIDYGKFYPVKNAVKQELGVENKKLILLVSDGWDEGKGFGRALQTARIAPADWHFLIIGVTSKQAKLLPENMIGLERVWDQKKLIEYYSAADVFYNPSLEETFGLVTAEALACGTPAVVMDSTACPEPLNGFGVVLKTFAPNAALEAITEALKLEKQTAYPFTIQRMTDGYLACYKNDWRDEGEHA